MIQSLRDCFAPVADVVQPFPADPWGAVEELVLGYKRQVHLCQALEDPVRPFTGDIKENFLVPEIRDVVAG